MRVKIIATVTVVLSMAMAQFALGDQLDDEAAARVHGRQASGAPAAVMVRVDPATRSVEVFRAAHVDDSLVSRAASSDLVESTIRATAVPANRIASFVLTSNELDRSGSSEACWWGSWYNPGWNWYGWGGYSYGYSYYPSYYSYPSCYNWYSPYSYYPGYFNYGGYYNYNYSWSYPYSGCYYGWYY